MLLMLYLFSMTFVIVLILYYFCVCFSLCIWVQVLVQMHGSWMCAHRCRCSDMCLQVLEQAHRHFLMCVQVHIWTHTHTHYSVYHLLAHAHMNLRCVHMCVHWRRCWGRFSDTTLSPNLQLGPYPHQTPSQILRTWGFS